MNLTWTRSSIPAHIGTGKITTYSTTLSDGTDVEIRSIEGTFFFRFNGEANSGSWADSLKEAKATVQRLEERLAA